MDEKIIEKSTSQLMAERFAKGVPTGAYAKSTAFEKAGGAAMRDLHEDPEYEDFIGPDMTYVNPDTKGTGSPEYIMNGPRGPRFYSAQWDALVKDIVGDDDEQSSANLHAMKQYLMKLTRPARRNAISELRKILENNPELKDPESLSEVATIGQKLQKIDSLSADKLGTYSALQGTDNLTPADYNKTTEESTQGKILNTLEEHQNDD